MLKLFRKIRRKLIDDKKIGNYLLYAMGEIVLVVIGILIALAINNSNEDRIKREKEQVYLVGLKKDFETSKIKLEELIRVNRESYGAAKEIMFLMDKEQSPSEQILSELFIKAFAYDLFFIPNNSLLNEMINSGSLKDIANVELRVLLTNWIATVDDVSNQEEFLSEQRNNVIEIFRIEGHSIRTIMDRTGMSSQLGLPLQKNASSNLKVLESIAFENDILMFIITSEATEDAHYQPLMQDLNNILGLIAKEIKTK
ncbi:hypothetical protein GTQ34_10080 [Muricauda sp. JGD-17]|uniref:Uncharacterized protein n=1 Tax=Flagellimonas ochracea TaxID=2696472 RepID=A0A964TEX6_9FLAO|nr:DUF6090 family protein [Allomuricauda ochracea]NAY92266.1 hypothetical protein [Allomuricauda ochracea]